MLQITMAVVAIGWQLMATWDLVEERNNLKKDGSNENFYSFPWTVGVGWTVMAICISTVCTKWPPAAEGVGALTVTVVPLLVGTILSEIILRKTAARIAPEVRFWMVKELISIR